MVAVLFIISHHPCRCTGAQPGSLVPALAHSFHLVLNPPVPSHTVHSLVLMPTAIIPSRADPHAAARERPSEIQIQESGASSLSASGELREHSLASRSYQACACPLMPWCSLTLWGESVREFQPGPVGRLWGPQVTNTLP